MRSRDTVLIPLTPHNVCLDVGPYDAVEGLKSGNQELLGSVPEEGLRLAGFGGSTSPINASER